MPIIHLQVDQETTGILLILSKDQLSPLHQFGYLLKWFFCFFLAQTLQVTTTSKRVQNRKVNGPNILQLQKEEMSQKFNSNGDESKKTEKW